MEWTTRNSASEQCEETGDHLINRFWLPEICILVHVCNTQKAIWCSCWKQFRWQRKLRSLHFRSCSPMCMIIHRQTLRNKRNISGKPSLDIQKITLLIFLSRFFFIFIKIVFLNVWSKMKLLICFILNSQESCYVHKFDKALSWINLCICIWHLISARILATFPLKMSFYY